ncbi:MAG: Rieske 2Fe-2S domain-containing protein [Proteobacteria bacterium]|nr:Rieske 2Fe-2S domain-containing protein [Pseudomonadota bacterium]
MSENHYQSLTSIDQVPENTVSCFELDGQGIAVSQVKGAFYAVTNKCSHANKTFDKGRMRGHKLICPVHGATFDIRDGSVLSLPAKKPIRSYPLKIKGDEIFIDLTESSAEKAPV